MHLLLLTSQTEAFLNTTLEVFSTPEIVKAYTEKREVICPPEYSRKKMC